MTKKITIDLDEHLRLLESHYKLQLLETAGVDNWDWYNYAFSDERVDMYFPDCPESASDESRLETLLKYFEAQATSRSFDEDGAFAQQTPFWKSIEQCPKIDGKEYLVWWSEIPKIVQAQWQEDFNVWYAGWTSLSDEHVSHFAEIPPLPEREVKP